MEEEKVYQAIIIGAGMSGSWVAKELCDRGLRTLLLDRGPNVKHLADYPTASKYPWEFEHRGRISDEEREANPIATQCYNYYEGSKHFFTKDAEQPYVQEKPFSWIRAYQVGGKSLLWARQVQRWSQYDFDGPKQDDFAVEWPVNYEDIAPWYDKVEEFIGVSGNYDGLSVLPDGKFLKPLGLTVVEEHFKSVIESAYSDRHVIYGRCAHLTEVKEIHRKQGRGQCQQRTICERGCPFGGFFSANSSTIPWAERTGHLTLRPNSVVEKIMYDDTIKKASGVVVIDRLTKVQTIYKAEVVFVNAGALNTNAILLNSTSERFPGGIGNDSELLGKFFSFHNYRARVIATTKDFADKIKDGRTPTNAYMPRFQNIKKRDSLFKRGYAIAIFTNRYFKEKTDGIGEDLLREMTREKNFGPWQIDAMMMGETIPKLNNRISLHPTLKDQYGIPQVITDIDYDENDLLMMEDFYQETEKMFEKAGFENIDRIDTGQAPGLDVHHMGGVRMGKDPKTSLLNSNNQMHTCLNVYITDGACMTSTGTQNPSLTFMAFAARAANHAIDAFELPENN